VGEKKVGSLLEKIRTGSAMIPLDRALLNSYRLSVVNIPLSVAIWPLFAMQIIKGFIPQNLPFLENRKSTTSDK